MRIVLLFLLVSAINIPLLAETPKESKAQIYAKVLESLKQRRMAVKEDSPVKQSAVPAALVQSHTSDHGHDRGPSERKGGVWRRIGDVLLHIGTEVVVHTVVGKVVPAH